MRRHETVVKETRRVNGLKVHRVTGSIKDQFESHGFDFKLNPINRVWIPPSSMGAEPKIRKLDLIRRVDLSREFNKVSEEHKNGEHSKGGIIIIECGLYG